MVKRKRGPGDVGSASEPDFTSSPYKRPIPEGAFTFKERAQKHLFTFARVVDGLAGGTAKVLLGKQAQGMQQNFMSQMLKPLTGHTSSADSDGPSDPFGTGGDGGGGGGGGGDEDDLYSNGSGFGGGGSPGFSIFGGEGGGGRDGGGDDDTPRPGGMFSRPTRASPAEDDSSESDEEADDDDDDVAAGATTSRGSDGGPSPSVQASLRHRGGGRPESRPPQDDDEAAIDATDDGVPAWRSRPSPYKAYGTFVLGCSLAVCWAIILLAIPLLPIIIASWLVSDFVQHTVFASQ